MRSATRSSRVGRAGRHRGARAVAGRTTPAFRDWWASYLRMGASPGAAVALTRMNAEIDIRDVLPSIRVPTLVLHRTGDRCLRVEEGRYLASHIPGASSSSSPGDDHLPFAGDQDAILGEIERFLARQPRSPHAPPAARQRSDGIGPRPVDDRFRDIYEREVEWYRGVPLGRRRLHARCSTARRARCNARRRLRSRQACGFAPAFTSANWIQRRPNGPGGECQPPPRAGRRARRSARLAHDRRPGAGLRAPLR